MWKNSVSDRRTPAAFRMLRILSSSFWLSASILTVSPSESAAIILQYAASTALMMPGGNVIGFLGHESHVASCGAHSAGMKKPSFAGEPVFPSILQNQRGSYPLDELSVLPRPAAAQEAPSLPRRLAVPGTYPCDEDFLVCACLVNCFAERVAHERAAPEVHAPLPAAPVCRGHGNAVGNRMAAHDVFPRRVPVAFGLLHAVRRAYGSGIEQHVCAHERLGARRLRKPLVVANQHACPCRAKVKHPKAEVAFAEIVLLEKALVVRDVDFPVFAKHLPVRPENCGRIVKAAAGFFVNRAAYDGYPMFSCCA